ncbi:MAG: flagellar M-ring protein FliF [Oscillospiraceae bacterium]|nr:flagellar M-ring protein FliF [Oscillospiraceae bacterium]
MGERLKQIWGKIRDFFKNMKKGLKIGLIAGLAVALILVVVLTIYKNTRPFVVLYSELRPDDMTAIVSYLDTAGVKDYRIRNNDTILVREEQANTLRAKIIMQGYPSSGYAYSTYLSNIGPLSSQADREQLVLYDLQTRLGHDIGAFDGVKEASVYLTPGEDHRYILSETVIQAKAAVKVTMQPNKTLSKDQVTAIQRLVSFAMKGVEISDVTVEDSSGNRYASSGSTADTLDETMKYKLGLEEQVNERIRNDVMNVLVPYFKAENVEVSVHSTVDVTHSVSELKQYFEPDWAADGSSGGRGIIGSQIWDNGLIRSGDQAAGGVVGTASNAEINEYVTNESTVRGDETEVHNSGEIVYDVSQQTTQTEHPPGTITDVTVAIAINSAKFDLKDPQKFVHMAAMAAGINAQVEAEKIAIVAYPFYQDSINGQPVQEISMLFGLPAWAVYAAIAGMALFLALLLIILLLRNKRKKKMALLLAEEEERERLAAEAEAAAAAAAAAAAQGADIMEMHTEETMKMRKEVRQFVEENPAIAAQMIKNWLRGEETDKLA